MFDNLSCSTNSDNHKLIPGVSIGFSINGKHYINSDLSFLIHLSSLTGETTINGFDVISAKPTMKSNTPVALEDGEEISYSYSILFDDSIPSTDTIRNQRFIKKEISPKLCYQTLLSVILSIAIPILMVSWVTYTENSEVDTDFDEYEGFEWKLIHGDVFRSPNNSARLTTFFGWGIQIFFSIILTIIQIVLHIAGTQFSSVLTAFMNSFVLSAFFAGFISSKMFKTIGTTGWKSVILKSSFGLSGIVTLIFFAFSLRMKTLSSSVSFPVSTVIIYFFTDSLFYFIGSLLGLKSKPFELSQKVNQLPRQIPPSNTIFKRNIIIIIGSAFVFSLIYIDVSVFFEIVWNYQSISITGLCVVLGIILCILQSIDLGIMLTFFLLSKEDYRWWWPSFASGASVGIYFMLYAIVYCIKSYVPLDSNSLMIYIGINAIYAGALALVCGAFSFIGSFFFIKRIYNSLKME
ncbi:Transmembrane 9 superfamily member 9 [Histomonas meleagridis]|uniref:Transmembrane 9 superfamily member 9 n=1 Tax=Histomonas meleagridis TaxID=135588 RepID=UPI00355A8587|nr:Transmembrane 9 superfamily member 9 [Histomonas meleagridis]KAH0797602.1 Transmembrane 9 superfamily member 9 [Histomonas meleagridis]